MFAVDPAKYYAFLAAMTLMAVSPGPANLFFLRTGLSGLKRHVFAGVAGVNLATLVWFIGAALGLHALMLAFPLAFRVMAVAGGLYLAWLGFSTLREALTLDDTSDVRFDAPVEGMQKKTLGRTLREGFVVQMLNPKVLLFFAVVLPPFIDITRPMPAQMSLFAATAIGMDVAANTVYGLLAVSLSHMLRQPVNRKRFDLGAGGLLLLIAALIIWHGITDLISPH